MSCNHEASAHRLANGGTICTNCGAIKNKTTKVQWYVPPRVAWLEMEVERLMRKMEEYNFSLAGAVEKGTALQSDLNRQVRATNAAIARGQNLVKGLRLRYDGEPDIATLCGQFEYDEKIALEG
jgi:hypothetical protein